MSTTFFPRIKTLRLAMGWSQGRMAEYLGCTQANVSRLEIDANGKEKGSIRKLLDLLEQQRAANEPEPEKGEAA